MSKLLLVAAFLFALLRSESNGNDRVSVFSTINVAEGDTAGDVVCAFCTVNVHGDVHGDIAVLFGTVSVSPDRSISGDVAVLFSSLHLAENDHISGDLAAALSSTDIPESAHIGGDRTVFSSGLGLGLLAGPILILAGIIGLVLFLVRRNRYPYPV